MTPTQASRRVIVERMALVQKYLRQIRSLPLQEEMAFFADSRNVWAAESCLRRALEALLDLGRHILAKGYGIAAGTYKEIPQELGRLDVLTVDETRIMVQMAGYRNRMTHFYYEVTEEELYQICTQHLEDLEQIMSAVRRWVRENPDKIDKPLGGLDEQ